MELKLCLPDLVHSSHYTDVLFFITQVANQEKSDVSLFDPDRYTGHFE